MTQTTPAEIVPPAARASDLPTCSCGHDRHSKHVTMEREYGQFAWALQLVGISARPKRVVFTCRTCGQTFDTSTKEEFTRLRR